MGHKINPLFYKPCAKQTLWGNIHMQNVHPLKANPVNPWIAVPCYNDANKQKPEVARLKTELPSLLPCQRQQTFRDSNSREIIIENEHLRLRICIVPTLSAWGYVHKFIKLLDMNVTAFPLQNDKIGWDLKQEDIKKSESCSWERQLCKLTPLILSWKTAGPGWYSQALSWLSFSLNVLPHPLFLHIWGSFKLIIFLAGDGALFSTSALLSEGGGTTGFTSLACEPENIEDWFSEVYQMMLNKKWQHFLPFKQETHTYDPHVSNTSNWSCGPLHAIEHTPMSPTIRCLNLSYNSHTHLNTLPKSLTIRTRA